MTWTNYLQHFNEILSGTWTEAPYDDPHFMEYTRLNHSRMNRWLKTGKLTADVIEHLQRIDRTQRWILITEPWCGDAAHSVPFLHLMAEQNQHIQFEIQLRDSGSEIDQYLTHGGKAVPVLIIRDEEGKDLAVWGPRPMAAQRLFQDMKEAGLPLDEQKVRLQQWYNDDKGNSMQQEFVSLLTGIQQCESVS